MDNSTEGEDHLVTAVVTMEEEEEGDGLIREVTRSVNATGGETTEMEQDVYYGGKALQANATVANESDIIIKLNNIHKTYLLGVEGVPALRGVSLTVRRGEFICIFGTSGGGKTTLLNIMGTIDKPTKGEMHVAGVRINSSTEDKDLSRLRRSHIGFVFQTFNLLSSLTALENVEMPMILDGKLSGNQRRKRAVDLLTRVGMANRLDHVPSQLSGGEQQRVTIARAVANRPDILLLDEPTGDLDTVNSAIVLKLLTDLNKEENITLIMVTHDVGLKFFADRIIWLRDGKIQRVETVGDVKQKEAYEGLHQDLIDLGISGSVDAAAERGDGESPEFRQSFANTEFRDPTDYRTHPRHRKGGPKLSTFAHQADQPGVPQVVVE